MAESTLNDRAGNAMTLNHEPPALIRLHEKLDDLPTALARIAVYVMENPEKVVRQTVSELGEFAGSGEASVIRLCQILGFTGFRDFKLALAAELGNPSLAVGRSASNDDEWESYRSALMRGLDIVHRSIDLDVYRRAADTLAGARRIDIFGTGVSGIIGELLSYRLLRMGLAAQAFRDGRTAHEVASGLDANCVACAISESGVTSETLMFLRSASLCGARTIALVSRLKSPIAKAANIVVHVPSAEPGPSVDSLRYVPGMIVAIETLAIQLARKYRDLK